MTPHRLLFILRLALAGRRSPRGAGVRRWVTLFTLLPLLGLAQPAPEPTPEPAPAEPPPTETPEQPLPPPAQVGVREGGIDAWLPPDQLLWLEAAGDRFPTRFRAELTGNPRGAVVILHDAGQHPSWPTTLAALFDELPRHGWHALALALPPPATLGSSIAPVEPAPDPAPPAADEAVAQAATEPTTAPVAEPVASAPPEPVTESAPAPVDPEQQSSERLAAALAHLSDEQRAAAIVLAGFGNGALRAVRFAAQPGARAGTEALVLVDFPVQEPEAAAESARLLAATVMPTLEIRQGDNELAARQARLRREATLSQRNRLHTQLQLPPLAAPTPEAVTPLVRRLRGWLQRFVGTDEPAGE